MIFQNDNEHNHKMPALQETLSVQVCCQFGTVFFFNFYPSYCTLAAKFKYRNTYLYLYNNLLLYYILCVPQKTHYFHIFSKCD